MLSEVEFAATLNVGKEESEGAIGRQEREKLVRGGEGYNMAQGICGREGGREGRRGREEGGREGGRERERDRDKGKGREGGKTGVKYRNV